jgi:hypothetical protein
MPLRSIGVLDGRPDETFGVIGDLVIGAKGDLFVLDDQAKVVHRVRGDSAIERIGGPGGGPGEFTAPGALWMQSATELVVADGEAMRLSVFDVTVLPARHVADVRLAHFVEPGGNGCVMEQHTYINAFDGTHAIQVLDPAGNHVASISEVPIDTSLPPVLQRELQVVGGVGRLTCVPEEDLLIFLPRWRARVYVLSPTGDVQADWPLMEYEQFTAHQDADGTTGFGPDPETGEAHQGLGTTWLGANQFIIQLGKIGDRREREEGPVEHRLFDVGLGEIARLRQPAPRFPVLRENAWYGYRNLPFPQVIVQALQTR